jgi:glycosyltransferase involved in cell wall biosynthesis
VSDVDAEMMRKMFGITNVTAIPTGVDVEYFVPPATADCTGDLVFVGSMDYMPNVDGVLYFVREILPLIHERRPDCTVTIVGRKPPSEIRNLAMTDQRIRVTGTVADVRPYLWGSSISIVPLRVGGGTRLKIYESMAAVVPVVSTTIGAEGLVIHPPRDSRIGDTSQEFAAHCLELLDDPAKRRQIANAGRELVSARFSWDQVCRDFEAILQSARQPDPVSVRQ